MPTVPIYVTLLYPITTRSAVPTVAKAGNVSVHAPLTTLPEAIVSPFIDKVAMPYSALALMSSDVMPVISCDGLVVTLMAVGMSVRTIIEGSPKSSHVLNV